MFDYINKPSSDKEIYSVLHPFLKKWFKNKFKYFSAPQKYGILPIHNKENTLIFAPTGTGKTHLTKALLHAACRKHFTAAFYPFHTFFDELAKADLNNRLDRLMKKLIKVDLLAIDDFGFKKLDQLSTEYLYAIVDARYSVKSMILTSNRAVSDWGSIFPDPFMANAIMDRLAHHSHHIVIKGESCQEA